MSKKSVLAALFLIFVGIVFGVVLVSSFRGGIEPGFAGDQQVKLGAPTPIKNPDYDPKALSKAFIEVSKVVSPTVVSITVTTKAKKHSSDMNDFFHFFGPDFKAPDPEPTQGAGSGVIITPEGYILTNNHVVDDADEDHVEVTTNSHHNMKAKIIGTDPSTDLAIIKVDGKDLPTAALGNSDALEVGEWVVAVGNPLGLQGTVTAGIVSAIGRAGLGIIRDEQGYGIENFIQTDAAINPGNSGGPLVNLKGEVIGINAAIATTNARYQGYGFAIPINLAQAVAEDLIKHGKVYRAWLGVSLGPVDETTAKALKLDQAGGVMVQTVVEGGAAKDAGLKEGDVILSVDDKQLSTPSDLQTYIARKHPADVVTLKLYRDGKAFEKKVTLKRRTDDKVAARNNNGNDNEDQNTEPESHSKSLTFDKLGMSVRALTSGEKRESSIDKGIVITDVTRFGEAFNRGLGRGDVILEADKKEIASPGDLKALLERRQPGDALLLRVKRGNGQMAYIAVQIPNS
ncbi:MAG: Do family serine endopeptidase [Ignavibacteriae bacterium]|nr:Do family serine endopeptidase [Ignavibacteria bacterium]MBI3365458.1 Do family serine endopeptidase [Ignavibacteriota bacterium]